jgi:hypothetical protein
MVLQQFDPVFEVIYAVVLLTLQLHLRHLVQKTAAHFADLRRRYGNPIIVLNLLKSKERRWGIPTGP